MDFGFSEEQDLLRQELRKWLEERCPLEEVRRIGATPHAFSPDLWKQLGELGYLGLGVPEAYGGGGLGWVDLAVLFEEMGRALHPSPLLSTTMAGAAILALGSDAQRERWLPGLADGSTIGTLALLEESDSYAPDAVALAGRRSGGGGPAGDWVLDGTKHFVPDAGLADLFVVPFRAEGSLRLALVRSDAPGVEVEPLPSIDPTKRLATLRLGDVVVDDDAVLAGGDGLQGLARVIDQGAAVVTAEMIGSIERALEITVRFAKERVQFGSPIGRYQGVKHPLAEIYVDVESLKSLLYYAMWALDSEPELAPGAIAEAKAFGSLAFSNAGIQGVQLHGAVGYTMEYDIQLFLKRSKWARAMYGDEDFHCDRVASLGGY